ncbi:MAG: ornithine carbamoyltransferase [candidate division WOR-3 bacterium]|nr:ornithine carbamoyltransferase [candidate division WOR-3 bacterium]
MKRDLVSIRDLNKNEFMEIIKDGIRLKEERKKGIRETLLRGKVLAMIFEKPSLRTRVTFQTGIYELGGIGIYLAPLDIQIGKRESIEDVARNLSRWVGGIMARTYSHSTVVSLAENASVPVINGLSDLEHPCQILADFQTIYEKKDYIEGIKLAFIGDGNNVCHSLMLASGLLGVNMRVAHPEGYDPKEEIIRSAEELASSSGGSITLTFDPKEAVDGVDVIYTDVWASMGQKDEGEKRRKVFAPYQVNEELTNYAESDYIFMHCLPACRGEEVTTNVIDGSHSVIYDEAENRLHSQKALMLKLMK